MNCEQPDTLSAWEALDDERDQAEAATRERDFDYFAKFECRYCHDGEWLSPQDVCPRCGCQDDSRPPHLHTYVGREIHLAVERNRTIREAGWEAYSTTYRERCAAGDDRNTAHQAALVAEKTAEREARRSA